MHPGVAQADAGQETLSQVVGAPGGPGSLGGPAPQARAKRDAIYQCAPVSALGACGACCPLLHS